MRLAFLVPAPDFDEPWRWAFDAEAEALTAAGVTVEPVPWSEPHDFGGYDLVLPLVTWGYHLRYAEWLSFLDRVEEDGLRLINPPALLRWNSHKRYLAELDAAGIPTVPTISVEQASEPDVNQARRSFGRERLVVKPPVSGGASGTFLIEAGEGLPEAARGLPTIIQPLIETIATAGEYSLMLFDGAFSHAVVKRPKCGDFRVQPHLGGTTERCEAPEGALELAQAALEAAPAAATYARVDIIPDEDGELRIMELELVEPALFLHLAPEAGERFAAAIISAAERAAEQPLANR